MIVTNRNISELLRFINRVKYLSIDTETTGLNPWLNDRLFSIIIGDDKEQFYLNFNERSEESFYKLKRSIIPYLYTVLQDKYIFMHNAKFDMAMLYQEGLDLQGPRFTIHDTMALARIEDNNHMSLSLDALGKKLGYKKIDEVKKYMSKHKLYNKIKTPGKKTADKDYFFDLVPKEIIYPYGKMDVEITHKLGLYQLKQFQKMDKPNIQPLVENEMKLTKVLFDIERQGMLIDKEYTERAYNHEYTKFIKCIDKFEELTESRDIEGKKTLKLIFETNNIEHGLTEKGNPSFNDESLQKSNNEIAKTILEYRNCAKLANSYYLNFLKYSDENNRIHANIRQDSAKTGRFSITNPALQTVGQVGKDHPDYNNEFLPRKVFIPEEDSILLAIDYRAQEMRLLFEYAKQADVIKSIIEGEDVHQSTADKMRVKRGEAKGLNFGICYGMGKDKLAKALGISPMKADVLKRKYFSTFNGIKTLIYRVSKKAETRGFIFNWFGRRSYFPDKNFCYKATNALIQGSGADIMKVALVKLHKFLEKYESRIVLTIHDEALFNIKNNEKHIIPELAKIMCDAYPHKMLPMAVDIEYSDKNWQEKKEYKF